MAQRLIILDTETTGLSPQQGDRLLEVCALEMIDGALTGIRFHHLVNPERDIPLGATQVHGITAEQVQDKPLFAEIADDLLGFIGESPFVAHNAAFDLGFLNAELTRVHRPAIPASQTIDTVEIAKKLFPGARLSLDALCLRFGIDLSVRQKHSALVDTLLLAEVYIELTGGKQRSLGLEGSGASATAEAARASGAVVRSYRPARPFAPTTEELERHKAFIETIKNALWTRL